MKPPDDALAAHRKLHRWIAPSAVGHRPAEGQRFAGTLVFEKAGTINVEFVVQGMGDVPAKAEDHSKHGK
ncbi:hypothetical protein [Rhizobium giardinii]|uniref:hypothetical protein n=1 Tax=Rhizobium giardinii TaxID=56731 RepID=UPI003D6DEF21